MTLSLRRKASVGLSILALGTNLAAPYAAYAGTATPITPIKHVIIIVGENRSFDHVFGVYKPSAPQTIWNLLSKGIVTAQGTPGPNFARATQHQAQTRTHYPEDTTPTAAYGVLPPPNTNGATKSNASPTSLEPLAPPSVTGSYYWCLVNSSVPACTSSGALALDYYGFAFYLAPSDYPLIATGATGLPTYSPDTRVTNATTLPNGPFQQTQKEPYDSYQGDLVHRFYQMAQQQDCTVPNISASNPSGCKADLYPFVGSTIGTGSNGQPFATTFPHGNTGEGSQSMGFYNTLAGDAPYLTQLAQQYTISDNYHQPIWGGTGADSVYLGTADALWYSDGKGNPLTPPANEIENPNPTPGTNNYYTQDGYSGGTYSNCSDPTQPGVGPILSYLSALPYQHPLDTKCAPGHYYLLNNYNPGYNGDASVNTSTFTIPPSSTPTIANNLDAANVSWAYYGGGWTMFQTPTNPLGALYCAICNPFLYSSYVMDNPNPNYVATHLQDVTALYPAIKNGTLPAVSYVKPSTLLDGHPQSSKLDLFEAFTKNILTALAANPTLAASTAVFITFDESGGFYDEGYIQPLDYFGDGPRIPLIIVSPFSRGGRVLHSYGDHVSIVKFIERNWNLGTISGRSRDNLPNPIASPAAPYFPTNSPAIDDLMDAFYFPTALPPA